MKIEWVTQETLPELIALGREMHRESRFRTLPFDEDRLGRSLAAAVDDSRGVYFLALARASGGKVVGGMFAVVEQPFFTSAIIANNYAFFVRPPYRGSSAALKLLTAFRRWAGKRGVRELHVHQTGGVENQRFDRMMRRAGFEHAGGNYIHVLGG